MCSPPTLYRRVIAIEEADVEAHHQLANLYAFSGDVAQRASRIVEIRDGRITSDTRNKWWCRNRPDEAAPWHAGRIH
ncbi:MAG TPA: hypothetical protein VF432_33155 [Thermoanaerobaculia bacterium]